ncbi:MAG: hypothetical protein MPJ50_16180 [Pirellulales bacterium]|nr:hypothetical protein [Pirellulales bacterium]
MSLQRECASRLDGVRGNMVAYPVLILAAATNPKLRGYFSRTGLVSGSSGLCALPVAT